VDREILVHRFRLRAVVPVVEARRADDACQAPEREADVGVHEHGVEGHEDEVGVHGPGREAEDVQRHEGDRARDDGVHQVDARAREPVERL
jgi:hypothetical protein